MNGHVNGVPAMHSRDAQLAEIPAEQAFEIVLKPISHPELDDIRIEDNLFAVGRTEAPFGTYAPEIVADLSRRHARIFSEYGAVYIADLDSKNGTTVNGASVQQKIVRLHNGDEICFAGRLSYRVQLGTRADAPELPTRTAKLVSLTLTPEHTGLGLQPIVITRFPFLISKTDDTFARYKEAYPHQVNYLSRRHAHIFVKGSEPYVEDLGSTNGTFVDGKRLDEHAVALKDGDLLAIGGHHFVYAVSLQKTEASFEPTVTMLSPLPASPAGSTGEVDKTTFVAAAGSFLDIFCVEQSRQPGDDEVNHEAPKQSAEAGKPADKPAAGQRQARSRLMIFISELSEAFAGGERKPGKPAWRWPGLLAVLLVPAAVFWYQSSTPERKVRDSLEDGRYEQAATMASQYLAGHPDNAEFRGLGTEALMRAYVPRWLAQVRARDFGGAATNLAQMKKLAQHNQDALILVNKIEWVGNLQSFVTGRGGADKPIKDSAEEGKVRLILQQWEDDSQGYQRAFTTISMHVPEFRDAYAEALSHLRKLALLHSPQQEQKGVAGNDRS